MLDDHCCGALMVNQPTKGRPRMPRFAVALFGALLIAMTLDASAQNLTSMPSGIKFKDDVVGTGPAPKAGQSVRVHYTGWLDQNGQKGKNSTPSRDRGEPFSFTLGA